MSTVLTLIIGFVRRRPFHTSIETFDERQFENLLNRDDRLGVIYSEINLAEQRKLRVDNG